MGLISSLARIEFFLFLERHEIQKQTGLLHTITWERPVCASDSPPPSFAFYYYYVFPYIAKAEEARE